MQSVTISRTIEAPDAALREAMLDLEPFMRAAGFDSVDVDGDTIHVANTVGIATIELELAIVPDPAATLTYEQREGIFEAMRTTYTVAPTEDGDASEVTATTQFALDVAIVGDVLDATVIKRQRRAELNAQFDYLEDVTES
jgi:carbon monoxide dehydrogenase subunit G